MVTPSATAPGDTNLSDATGKWRVSKQFLNGTLAHIRLFSALPWCGRFT